MKRLLAKLEQCRREAEGVAMRVVARTRVREELIAKWQTEIGAPYIPIVVKVGNQHFEGRLLQPK